MSILLEISFYIGLITGIVLSAGVAIYQLRYRFNHVTDFITDLEKRVTDAQEGVDQIRGKK